MNSFKNLVESGKLVLADFSAEWCGPCKMMAPILKETKEAMGDKATIIKIDVDKNRDVAEQLNIQGVPTLIVYKNGEIKWRQSGVVPSQTLVSILKEYSN
ncbi:MAG: thioredoxin [Flavisolibacter sp.]|jgi:thioredoxin 1